MTQQLDTIKDVTSDLHKSLVRLYLNSATPVDRFTEVNGKSIDRDDMFLISSQDIFGLLEKTTAILYHINRENNIDGKSSEPMYDIDGYNVE